MVVPVGRDMNLLMRNHQFEVSSLEQSLTTLLSDEQKGQIMDLRLMMLRFILSSDGNVSKAEANLKSYIEWRFKSDDGRAVYTCIQSSRYPHGWETMQKFSAVGFHGQSLDGDFLFVIRAGLSNGKALMSALTHDQLVHIMIFNRARMMEICDEETLKTGRLTKFITINDVP